MTTKAAEKRYAAIRSLSDDVRYVKQDDGPVTVVWTQTHEDRAVVAAAIREMADLGRTDRWRGNVERWAIEVEDSTPETFTWAFDQFAVWTAYAAE